MTMSRDPAPRTAPEYPPGDQAPPAPPGDPADVLAGLGGSWTWILASAIATVVPGVIVLVWPDETLHVLAVLIGLYLLVGGVFRFVTAFSRREHGERLPALLVAVLFVLAGVLCLRHPLQTVATLSLIVGAVWLVGGILTAYTALTARDLPHRGFVLGAAALACVAGVLVLATPTDSARALTRLLGVWLVLLGVAELALALAWRSALRRALTANRGGPAVPD
ncbi:HdeD family acid-resistance protein [Streptomyces sp. NPDC005799]|uniref:HdeD family acid-resistance protein n=1 Tax=Streptomyces sp. NPDC005799 TaxID=3154678 RepID=UPI003403FB65